MSSRAVPAAVLLFACVATPVVCQETAPPPELTSGPAAGTALPECKVWAPSGPFAGTEFDAAARIGKGPGVLLFVQELSRNTGQLIMGLDRIATEFAWTGLEAHTIRIAADRTEAEAAVKRSSEALKMLRPIVVSTDGLDGPGGYALHRKATLTLVTCKDGVVVRSVAFTDTGRADLPRLRSLVEEVTGPVPKDPAALRAALAERLPRDPEQLRALATELALLLQRAERRDEERAQPTSRDRMQRPPQADGSKPPEGAPPAKPRVGKAPEDEELRGLLRRVIQQAADAAELDAVYAAVAARVGDDAGLRSQAVEMFKLQVSLGYGNDDSRARAQKYVDANGTK